MCASLLACRPGAPGARLPDATSPAITLAGHDIAWTSRSIVPAFPGSDMRGSHPVAEGPGARGPGRDIVGTAIADGVRGSEKHPGSRADSTRRNPATASQTRRHRGKPTP